MYTLADKFKTEYNKFCVIFKLLKHAILKKEYYLL